MKENTDTLAEFEMLPPENEFECARFDITDDILSKAKIVAYMYGQEVTNDRDEKKPYNPKTFPQKAIDIIVRGKGDNIFDLYLDSETACWDSDFVYNGEKCKLGPDQMAQFFKTDFYSGMQQSLEKRWPLSDPTFAKMFEGVKSRRMKICNEWPPEALTEKDGDWDSSKNMPNKRVDLANKDTTGDGQRDYTSTGRKIVTFSDMGVRGNSGQYYCWPNPKYPFKWSQWKDWTRIKPFAKMSFVHNNRRYGISLSLFDENFENRGFRGYDAMWHPPLGWITPGECEQVMKLSIVRKFLKQCLKRVKEYLDMTPEEVYEKINNKDKITVKEIEKTQRVIKHVIDVVFRKQQADTYCFN